jgi:hypothetical protein
MQELTPQQEEVMQNMALEHEGVKVEDCPPRGALAVIITPVRWCAACGGDGTDPLRRDCLCQPCDGTGSILNGVPVRVLPDGQTTPVGPWMGETA